LVPLGSRHLPGNKDVASEQPTPALSRQALLWRWFVWCSFLIAWSRALLVPSPDRFLPSDELRHYSFEIAKTLHVTAYALFAILSGWLRVPWRYRWLLFVGMVAHAAGTEFLQQFIKDRHPSVRDVAIDLVGIALGMMVSWRWWRNEPQLAPASED
jgi:VanZ family protein